jgi:CBS domain-containing protein
MVEKRRAELGTVRDWMTRQPVTAPPDATVAQVAGLMRANRIRHVLVVDDERVVGVVSERDVRGLVLEGEPTMSPKSPVREVMNDLPVTVTPETPLTEASRAMLDRKIGALPVLEDDRPIGILTVADALEALLQWVEYGTTTMPPGSS